MKHQNKLPTSTKRILILTVVVVFETFSRQALRRGMEERLRDVRGEKIITARLNQFHRERLNPAL